MQKFLIFIIKLYKIFISTMFAPCCRYLPSCSDYAIDALYRHNLTYAISLIVKRVLRCQPFGGSGYDPVPESNQHK